MKLLIFTLLWLSTSCTMFNYLSEQGVEQVKLQWSGRSNDEFLSDPNISDEMKRKVLLVEEYKKYFFHFFSEKPSTIYSKTVMLPNSAVTYLVIASTHTKMQAKEFDFPIMGSFPYLGFFKKDSALKFAEDLRNDQNLVTFVRPVYAYSTLGYLEDRILSSFFHYDDVELAELVFHELFHTIYFIKDEVDLNENLANLYGKELLREYFKGRPQLTTYLEIEDKKVALSKRVVELIGILQGEFDKLGAFITDENADILTKRFVNEVFRPEIQNFCSKVGLPGHECELKEDWNQARFAAFLTYEEEQDFLEKLKLQLNLDLKEYLNWLKIEYKRYSDQKAITNFTDYLKLKVPSAPIAPN